MNAERADKHRRLAAWLDPRGLDGVVLTRRCNFSWATGGAHNHVAEAGDVGVSSLVARADGAAVVANNIEATRLRAEDLPEDVPVVEYPYYDADRRAEAFAEATGGGRFAADAPLEGLEPAPTDAAFDRLRWSLTPAEIDRYRALGRDVACAVEGAARAAAPGETEADAAGRLAGALRAAGCVPWVLLVGADERIARHRHPLPTGAEVRHALMLVAVAERAGLLAACTRLVAFGGLSDDLARRHRAVVAVDAALIGATRPAATLGEAFAAAQAAYAREGFPEEWRRHHQGGSIGYLPREVKAAPGSDVPVLADQAFAWNPSVAGTKCEDTVLCTDAGCEVLTRTGRWPEVDAGAASGGPRRPDILVL